MPAERDSRRLTDQWRQRVANIRLNRKGQPKLTIPQLMTADEIRRLLAQTPAGKDSAKAATEIVQRALRKARRQ
jgi:hypothetical protein